MPDTLTNQQIAEIELREYVVEGWGRFIKLRPDERDSLITTVKQLRHDNDLCAKAFELDGALRFSEVGNLNALQIIRKLADLQSQLEQLRAENEALRKWQRDVEEREAAVCPEDVPFDEYIWALKKRAAQATEDRDELSTEMETCHSLLDQFYAEDPVMTSADTLEKRLKLHLDELRPVITDDDVNGDD